jgi:hypothetical protein
MELWKPIMLWGALTIALPILLHFWHQKRGTVLAWAATSWLLEKNQQQRRGFRLDNLLLLLLRCLILLLLALLLSQPVLRQQGTLAVGERVHLVQPDALLAENFRFELEEARRKGEEVYWIGPQPAAAADLRQVPASPAFQPGMIQTAINKVLRARPAELHLYLLNQSRLAEVPFVEVPADFQLHAVADTSRRQPGKYLKTATGKFLLVNENNRLVLSTKLPPAARQEQPVGQQGTLRAQLDYADPAQQQTVEAALRALVEVYEVPLQIEKDTRPGYRPDWVLTDHYPGRPEPATLYLVSDSVAAGAQRTYRPGTLPQLLYQPEVFTPGTSERVSDGKLPEWLGELLVRQLGLAAPAAPLTRQELEGLFVTADRQSTLSAPMDHSLSDVLVLVLLVLVGAERWMALRKNS